MRIRNSKLFLENQVRSTRIVLNDTTLVIDAHNYLYKKYKDCKLNYLFGCECDKYAMFLREQLSVFRKANVKCYFLFKGGNQNNTKLLNLDVMHESELLYNQYYAQPLFTREVNKQVMDEMGFDYAICEYANKKECIALAQELNCPIMSLDAEIFFSGIPYIPFPSLDFHQSSNTLECQLYKLDDLLDSFKIGIEQITFFLTIFDEYIFSREFVENLLRKLRVPLSFTRRHTSFLQWLSRNSEKALEIISDFISQEEYQKIVLEMKKKCENSIQQRRYISLPSQYLLNKDLCKIKNCDPEWFPKGVLWKFISISYINVYKYRIVEGSWSAEDYNAKDSLLLSAPIIRYAFDLLTNFKNEKITYKGRRCRDVKTAEGTSTKMDSDLDIQPSVRKPDYGDNNVFENGWDNILDYKLFEHFLEETLQLTDLNKLKKLPSDASLLIISLLYFSRQKNMNVDCEVYAILLSYVVLGVLNDETIGEETLDKNDRISAIDLMDEYFHVPREKLEEIYDPKMLHPLVEFQHCLRHINFLNTLCGSPFAPTIYSKTFNATFVYCVVRDLKKCESGVLLDEKLKKVPTVQCSINNLVNLYKEM